MGFGIENEIGDLPDSPREAPRMLFFDDAALLLGDGPFRAFARGARARPPIETFSGTRSRTAPGSGSAIRDGRTWTGSIEFFRIPYVSNAIPILFGRKPRV